MAYNNLGKGSSGSGVTELQTDLTNLGFTITVNGSYDSVTEQAVKSFQYTYGIQVSGIVDSQTSAAIKEATGLLASGQWDPKSDPITLPSDFKLPTAPLISSTGIGGIDWKWIGIGALGIAALFFLKSKGGDQDYDDEED